MGWSRVLKTINGHRYVYEQRTWRDAGRVRTESRYIGREGRGMPIIFHGSRQGIRGLPHPSDSATYGPGFYLAERDDAELYAKFDPELVSSPDPVMIQHRGTVYAFDARALHLLVIKNFDAYFAIVGHLLGRTATDVDADAKVDAYRLWQKQGYDGLMVLGKLKPATVVFPASIPKLGSSLSQYRVAG
jgi:hypothetical protein